MFKSVIMMNARINCGHDFSQFNDFDQFKNDLIFCLNDESCSTFACVFE